MAIFNLGSINIDHFYRLPHLVRSSETLSAKHYSQGLGGKGTNQSVAMARAGADVIHIGAMNANDLGYLSQIQNFGINTDHIKTLQTPTGHGIVMIDDVSGENQIVVYPGANQHLTEKMIDEALLQASDHDWALCQNETNNTAYFLQQARLKNMKIGYSAAPFVAQTTLSLLPMIDLLVVNEVEAKDLEHALEAPIASTGIDHVIITRGSKGVRYVGVEGDFELPAPKVNALDTTGAGDTFLGLFLARFSHGYTLKASLTFALTGAAIQVTRLGTADAIPTLDEIEAQLNA